MGSSLDLKWEMDQEGLMRRSEEVCSERRIMGMSAEACMILHSLEEGQ